MKTEEKRETQFLFFLFQGKILQPLKKDLSRIVKKSLVNEP
jgi:hypothetical protein